MFIAEGFADDFGLAGGRVVGNGGGRLDIGAL